MRSVTREDAVKAVTTTGRWVVLRHGGNDTHGWRDLGNWPDVPLGQRKATELYKRMQDGLRQGGLALIGPNGEVYRFDSAPRLRTRW